MFAFIERLAAGAVAWALLTFALRVVFAVCKSNEPSGLLWFLALGVAGVIFAAMCLVLIACDRG